MIRLSPRLAAVASLVREGAFLADVGTDHAQLPAALATSGKIKGAVASDVHEGPVLRAKECILAHRLHEKIEVLLTDGLNGLERYEPTDIVIAGMGGELIRDIIATSPIPKRNGVRLILQPMTMQKELREYLTQNHFYIREELLARDEGLHGRIYNILCAEYDEIHTEPSYSPLELVIGRRLIEAKSPLFGVYITRQQAILDRRIDGMNQAHLDTAELRNLRADIAALIDNEVEHDSNGIIQATQ